MRPHPATATATVAPVQIVTVTARPLAHQSDAAREPGQTGCAGA